MFGWSRKAVGAGGAQTVALDGFTLRTSKGTNRVRVETVSEILGVPPPTFFYIYKGRFLN
jgi:hypothetical protein